METEPDFFLMAPVLNFPWNWADLLLHGFGIWHLAFGIWYLAFGVWYLAFGIWHFGIWHLAFGMASAVPLAFHKLSYTLDPLCFPTNTKRHKQTNTYRQDNSNHRHRMAHDAATKEKKKKQEVASGCFNFVVLHFQESRHCVRKMRRLARCALCATATVQLLATTNAIANNADGNLDPITIPTGKCPSQIPADLPIPSPAPLSTSDEGVEWLFDGSPLLQGWGAQQGDLVANAATNISFIDDLRRCVFD